MKTNIVLISRSRDLFGIPIRQETKNGFLNVSDLQAAYNNARSLKGWSEKRVDQILTQVENRERVYFILKETGSINVEINTFMECCEKKGFYKYLKELKVYKTSGRGVNKSTSCDPYIWGLLAMELNPEIYGKIVVWFTDRLILNRIEAGDMYKDLSKAVAKFPATDYSNLAKALNHIVFGRHEFGIRNTGTEEQLKELHKIESNLAFSIDAGFIKSFPELMEHIRTMWTKKYQPNAVSQ